MIFKMFHFCFKKIHKNKLVVYHLEFSRGSKEKASIMSLCNFTGGLFKEIKTKEIKTSEVPELKYKNTKIKQRRAQ